MATQIFKCRHCSKTTSTSGKMVGHLVACHECGKNNMVRTCQVEIDCPHCSEPLQVSDKLIGKAFNCPKCTKDIEIEADAEEPSEAVDVNMQTDAFASEGDEKQTELNCPFCKTVLSAPLRTVGEIFNCLNCNKHVQVPVPYKQQDTPTLILLKNVKQLFVRLDFPKKVKQLGNRLKTTLGLLAHRTHRKERKDRKANPGVCPHCRKSMPINAVFCVNCGTNLNTGKRVHSQVVEQSLKTRVIGYKSFNIMWNVGCFLGVIIYIFCIKVFFLTEEMGVILPGAFVVSIPVLLVAKLVYELMKKRLYPLECQAEERRKEIERRERQIRIQERNAAISSIFSTLLICVLIAGVIYGIKVLSRNGGGDFLSPVLKDKPAPSSPAASSTPASSSRISESSRTAEVSKNEYAREKQHNVEASSDESPYFASMSPSDRERFKYLLLMENSLELEKAHLERLEYIYDKEAALRRRAGVYDESLDDKRIANIQQGIVISKKLFVINFEKAMILAK